MEEIKSCSQITAKFRILPKITQFTMKMQCILSINEQNLILEITLKTTFFQFSALLSFKILTNNLDATK